MEPQIQYARTTDGVNIAYYAMGQGPAVLFLLLPPSHLEAEWRVERLRLGYTAIAQTSTLVRLDPRGFGLSDRDPPDFRLDSIVLDIETVVDRLGLESVSIYSWGAATVPALAYTARHTDRVTHLVQTPPAASYQDIIDERLEKVLEITGIDQKFVTETFTRMMNPGEDDQYVSEVMEHLGGAETIFLSDSLRWSEDSKSWNADSDAATMSTPTLLIHQRNSTLFNIEKTRRVAGLIPNSRVAFVDSVFEGAVLAQRFFHDRLDDVPRPAQPGERSARATEAMRTILFTDVEGSTALTDRLGDEQARELLREHERITRQALREHAGSEVKTMGDGFMTSFGSATSALECAIAIQRGIEAWNESADEPMRVRIGLDAGEPIEEDEDLFGTAVNEAARICSVADGGEILVANVVRELTKGKNFLFNDRGETSLRGFEDPVRLFEVRWRE